MTTAAKLSITALVDSKLKKEPIDSSLLKPGQVCPFPRGKSFQVVNWSKAEGDHIKVELDYGSGTWYCYDPHTYFPPTDDKVAIAPKQSRSKFLTEQDYIDAARMMNCSVTAIKAVAKIEANGGGFYTQGRLQGLPKLLFESLIFGKKSGYKFNQSHPILSQVNWNRSLYKRGGHSWDKLHQASELNESAAIQACSWGKFQVMGFHFKTCGFESPQAYAKAQHTSEFEHLRCMLAFCKSKGLDRHLRNLDWNRFSYGYNGELYFKNRYHIKLAQAYSSFS